MNKFNKIILNWRYAIPIGLVCYLLSSYLQEQGGILESIGIFVAIIGWVLFIGIFMLILDIIKFVFQLAKGQKDSSNSAGNKSKKME